MSEEKNPGPPPGVPQVVFGATTEQLRTIVEGNRRALGLPPQAAPDRPGTPDGRTHSGEGQAGAPGQAGACEHDWVTHFGPSSVSVAVCVLCGGIDWDELSRAIAAAAPAPRSLDGEAAAIEAAQRAYEAYVMAAPDDLEFPEWDRLPGWQQDAMVAGAQEAYETRAHQGISAAAPAPAGEAVAALLADRNQLRETLRRIALGSGGDPSVAADKALTASRDYREQWEALEQPQAALDLARAETAAIMAAAANTARELAEARELLGEIGVLAANAPEDGDSFGLLEEIAMRIAAMDVEDDGRHPDGCTCQFCREDEREERQRADREDDDSMADIIPEDWCGEAMT